MEIYLMLSKLDFVYILWIAHLYFHAGFISLNKWLLWYLSLRAQWK